MQITVVVTCKDRDNIYACVSSIRACRPRPSTIVVDFGSKIPIEFPNDKSWVNVIRVTKNTDMFHKARAINIGIRRVTTKFLCITDADQLFQPNFFGEMCKVFQNNSRSFVMCKTYSLKETPTNTNFDTGGLLFSELLKKAKKSGVVLHGDGCCNGVLTQWAINVRGYDESYIGYRAQDSDFALRAVKYGLPKVWLEKKTNMIHLPHQKTGDYYKENYRVINKQKYKDKTKLASKKILVSNPSGKWGEL